MNDQPLRIRDFWTLADRAAAKPQEVAPILADLVDEHDSSPIRADIIRRGAPEHHSAPRGPDHPAVHDVTGQAYPAGEHQPRVILGDEGNTIRELGDTNRSGLPNRAAAHAQVGPETFELFHSTALHDPGSRRWVVRYTLRTPSRRTLRLITPVTAEQIRALGEHLPNTGMGHTWDWIANQAERSGHVDTPVKLAREHEFLPTDEANPFERHAWDRGGAQPGTYRILAFRPAKGKDGEWTWQHHSVRHVGLTQPEAAWKLEFDPKNLNEMLERHASRLSGRALTPTERQWAGIDPTEHDEGIPEFHQLARMKAPAGGAIVNNQYQKGGQFLARTLQSIRSVADKLRKLARGPDPEHDALLRAAAGALHREHPDATALAAFGDFLEERGRVGGNLAREGAESHVKRGRHWPLQSMFRMDLRSVPLGDNVYGYPQTDQDQNHWLHVMHGGDTDLVTPLHYSIPLRDHAHLLSLVPDDAARQALLVQMPDLPLGSSGHANHLSRPAASPAVTAPLTLGELKQIEDEHALPKNARLSPHVEQPAARAGDEHPYAANVEHIARFLDGLSKSRVQPASFRKILTDDKRSDVNKFVHLTAHLGHEHREAEKIGWYGEHLDTLDKALHKHFGWGQLDPATGQLEGKHDPAAHHPELVLFKALVGATSPSQNPVDNLSSALRAWKAGAAAGDPILNAPHFNTPALKAFTDKLPAEALTPGMTPVEHAKWYAKFVEGKHATGEGVTPYAARTARIVLPSGLLLDHDAHGKTVKNPDAKGYRLKAGERVAQVDLPLVDSSGAIRPKGWARYGQQTAAGILKLQNLVRSFSGKDRTQKQAYTDAARWLLQTHTPEEFNARMKRAKMDKAVNSAKVYSSGFLDKKAQEAIPGTFIFGPKVGPFVLNLHSNDPRTRESFGSYLTADKWWSRTFHRYLGKLVDAGDSPSARTRGLMRKVVKQVAAAAGVTPAELQADLWYHEQNLYRLLGAKSAESYSYADAAKKFLLARDETGFLVQDPDNPAVKYGWWYHHTKQFRLATLHPHRADNGSWRWLIVNDRGPRLTRDRIKSEGIADAKELHRRLLTPYERKLYGIDPPDDAPEDRPNEMLPEDYYAG